MLTAYIDWTVPHCPMIVPIERELRTGEYDVDLSDIRESRATSKAEEAAIAELTRSER